MAANHMEAQVMGLSTSEECLGCFSELHEATSNSTNSDARRAPSQDDGSTPSDRGSKLPDAANDVPDSRPSTPIKANEPEPHGSPHGDGSNLPGRKQTTVCATQMIPFEPEREVQPSTARIDDALRFQAALFRDFMVLLECQNASERGTLSVIALVDTGAGINITSKEFVGRLGYNITPD
jgi:hypothetical protein